MTMNKTYNLYACVTPIFYSQQFDGLDDIDEDLRLVGARGR